MIIDYITFAEVFAVKNIFKIFGFVGGVFKFVKNIFTAPFAMYHF